MTATSTAMPSIGRIWRGSTFPIMLVAINSSITCGLTSSCPSTCKCFYVIANELDNPPTYNPITSDQDEEYALLAVSCQRQQLTAIPEGLPTVTVVLFLAYNRLEYLEKSMFENLGDIRTLDLSHNKIKRIAEDSFDSMKKLEYLNIAYNDMTIFPRGFLCPWHHTGNNFNANKAECEEQETATSVVGLNMVQNPWHCNCTLQEFVERVACKNGRSPCVEFIKILDSIGECFTPSRLSGTPISRFSSQTREQSHNLCTSRSHIDIPMIITMFTWFGAVVGYIMYFIRWNTKENARQSSYLASLDKKPQQPGSDRAEEGQDINHASQSPGPGNSRVRTSGYNQNGGQKTRTDDVYAVSSQVESHQGSSATLRQKVRRSSISYPSRHANKLNQEEIYRMSSL